jgi:hypothetical protein
MLVGRALLGFSSVMLLLNSWVGVLESMGHDVLEDDIARVSPLKTKHVKVLGEYRHELHPDVVDGDLRPLRDPNSSVGLEDAEVFGYGLFDS